MDDQKHGKGVFDYLDGRKYEGEWETDTINGFGTMYNAKGKVDYEGEWINGKHHGSGNLWYANGERYEGDFNEDQKHGKGNLK